MVACYHVLGGSCPMPATSRTGILWKEKHGYDPAVLALTGAQRRVKVQLVKEGGWGRVCGVMPCQTVCSLFMCAPLPLCSCFRRVAKQGR